MGWKRTPVVGAEEEDGGGGGEGCAHDVTDQASRGSAGEEVSWMGKMGRRTGTGERREEGVLE